MNVKKKNSGRRGKFVEWLKSEGLIKIEGWARDGLTDEQIAANIGISRSTLNEWKKKYSDISDTLKRGKEVVDRQVENALLKRALGYQYNEVTQEKTWSDDLGIYEMSVTKIVIKEVNPDVTAQIFWLKNRKPKDWRDKQDIQHSGNVEINNPMKDLTAEELRKLINK
ncbi:transcriptional regulator with XRE-family HTH domain [Sporosarcina psychrophila]|uniref:Transcriptional regulator with XRE-family HTH domain n=1 Tax=Sporosarcina psychrophila TaxID=1476 RepID=A0ABV2KCS7_SPOPS